MMAQERRGQWGITKTCSQEGSRIINLEQLATFIGYMSAYSQSCQGSVSLTGEHYREGLASALSASSNSCRLEVAFPTSSKVTGLGGGQQWECNLAAVWRQMSIWGGHAPLTGNMSLFGVPVMTKKSFITTKNALGEWCKSQSRRAWKQLQRKKRGWQLSGGHFMREHQQYLSWWMGDGANDHISIPTLQSWV